MNERVILLVEDNSTDESLTLRAFRKNNILNKVIVVRDGVEALDYLFARGIHTARDAKKLPTVVVLDLSLPRSSGLDVLRAIRADERTKFLPVVILTSSKDDNSLLSAYGFGANSYVVKPVEFDEFTEALRHLGAYWLSLNEGPP